MKKQKAKLILNGFSVFIKGFRDNIKPVTAEN